MTTFIMILVFASSFYGEAGMTSQSFEVMSTSQEECEKQATAIAQKLVKDRWKWSASCIKKGRI